jgi:hypothetical protein
MAIKFSCPNCGKALVVKDQLAGKRGACSGCKVVITIPYPVSQAHHDDVEAMAREAFADAPAAAPPVETKTIEFNCPMCDELVKVSADLAGKQTPCPECRRIVKVPLPTKRDPTDWRKLDKRGPSGAKQDLEPAPEGTWGSSTAGGVSRETLLETGAIVEEEDPDARRRRHMRLTMAGIVVVALLMCAIGVYSYTTRGKADKYLARALEAAKGESKLPPEQVAAVHWGAAEYQARSGQPDAAQKANEEFGQARGALGKAGSLERDVMLGELALAQIDLGGVKSQADKGQALEWSKALEAVRQTLEQIKAPEAKLEAVRQVTRKLAAAGQAQAAQSLAGRLGGSGHDANELIAVAALELLRGGNKKEGMALADSIAAASASKEKTPPPPSPAVVALAVLLGRDEPKPRASDKKDEVKANEDDLENIVLGRAEGLARRGNSAAARQLLGQARPAIRLRGLVALAAVAADSGSGDTADLNAALDLAEGELKGRVESPWLLFRLAQLAVKAGQADRAMQVAGQIPDAGLQAQAQLAGVRARLSGMKERADDALTSSVAEKTGAAALARLALARHNMARDSGTAKTVESWSDADRAPGLAGLALGMQDKRR